jgi:sugar lactone lactonase YvrE
MIRSILISVHLIFKVLIMSKALLSGCLSVVLMLTVVFIGCKKDDGSGRDIKAISMSPDTGPFNTVVTISGSGFSPSDSLNLVTFNNMPAKVQDATETIMHVIVPKGAGTGPVIIRVGDRVGNAGIFNYVYTVTVKTIAGRDSAGYVDASDTNAMFNHPSGIAVDGNGNLFITDASNHRIRQISPPAMVSTLAGADSGYAEGYGNGSRFYYPRGIAIDMSGKLYVADSMNSRIRKIDGNLVSTFSGKGPAGSTDGLKDSSLYRKPSGITVSTLGAVFIADAGNNRIRKINTDGLVTTLGGNIAGYAEGTSDICLFNNPLGIAVDVLGNVYVADANNNRIRKIRVDGVTSTFAGSGAVGSQDGTGSFAQFNHPTGLAIDAKGNLYVADAGNNKIRKINTLGEVSTWAGSGTAGHADTTAPYAQFKNPKGVAVDAKGNVYVADELNNRIRKIIVE